MEHDIEYTFGRPLVYLSERQHARLVILKARFHERIPNGLPYMVEFETVQAEYLAEYQSHIDAAYERLSALFPASDYPNAD